MPAFYHGSVRSLIILFGDYFSNIHVIRRVGDSVDGKAIQDIRVPIALSNRSKWIDAILNPDRDKQVKWTLPRIGFEIVGFSYDASRKKSRNQQIKCVTEDGKEMTVDTPAPWNVEISMYIGSKTQEDALQIVEQIIPKFNPDINFKIKNVMGIVTDIPLSLTGISSQDDYEGSYTEDRLVVYTLNFTAKMEFYGAVNMVDSKPIYGIDLNLPNEDVHIKSDGSYSVCTETCTCGCLDDNDFTIRSLSDDKQKSPAVFVRDENLVSAFK